MLLDDQGIWTSLKHTYLKGTRTKNLEVDLCMMGQGGL